jgi:uncharacterized UBP type Zn finger protein
MVSAWRYIPKGDCPHQAALAEEKGSDAGRCAECGHGEDLRRCLHCGYVACGESHAGHNTAHWRASGHALIRPHNAGYDWLWCYACNAFLK